MPEYKRMSELFSQYIEKCAYIQQMIAPSSWNEAICQAIYLEISTTTLKQVHLPIYPKDLRIIFSICRKMCLNSANASTIILK